MRILTFSSLYPNSAQPGLGLFVEERLRQMLNTGAIEADVVAPVPWIPFRSSAFRRYAEAASVPKTEIRHGISVRHPRYPLIPLVGMSATPKLMAYAMKPTLQALISSGRDFDLIDAHFFYPDGAAAVLLARWFSKPVVITARGSDINVIAKHRSRGRTILRSALAADGIISVSAALRDEMERLGVPAAKIRVLRNGVDLNRFRPDGRNEARRDLGLEGSTLLIVGHLRPTKGHERVLQAMTKLPDFNLLIVGDGPLRRSIEVMSQTLSIGDRVRFCGQMSQDELIRYYTAADALILASDREGMPNVVLEALACGTPVVATPVGGVPEVLTESVAGVVADDFSADALVVAVNRLFRQYPDRMATRKYAMNHSWKGTTEGQLDLFGEILMRRQTG